MPHTSPSLVYPHRGQVYLADSPELEKKGELKYGYTTQTLELRESQHSGQLSSDKSKIFFFSDSLDAFSGETLLKAYFHQRGMHVQGRKELIFRDIDLAKELLTKAVQLAPVRSAKLLSPRAPATRLHSECPAWSALLSCLLQVGGVTKPLAEWMASSLHDSSLARRLEKRGVLCINCDSREPEFRIETLDPVFERWMENQGFPAEALIDPVLEAASAIFSVSKITA